MVVTDFCENGTAKVQADVGAPVEKAPRCQHLGNATSQFDIDKRNKTAQDVEPGLAADVSTKIMQTDN